MVMALFVSLPENLHVYAQADISLIKLLFPAMWVTVIWGLAGIVIGLIYGRQSATQEEFAMPEPAARRGQ